jgi:L-phenylalanine/L-methionine N-acetyltransferase
MSTDTLETRSDDPAPPPARACPTGLTIRAREPSDWQEIATLRQLPRVRWGTLATPFVSGDATRKFLENPPEGRTGIVAVLDGKIVGTADLTRDKGRRSHVGHVGICVHDAFHERGIGSGLMAALIDTADNWLDLRRLELAVYVDNAPAIRLYRKFGFAVEGTRRAVAFRDGAFVDDYVMARLRGL